MPQRITSTPLVIQHNASTTPFTLWDDVTPERYHATPRSRASIQETRGIETSSMSQSGRLARHVSSLMTNERNPN